MAESPDALLEQVARAIYAKYPDRQPWDGDSYAFGENPGGYRTELARSQARSVLDAVAPAIRAQALRDAADQLEADCDASPLPCFCTGAPRLRERAGQIHPKEES